jgi:dUTP pyrophosphatase
MRRPSASSKVTLEVRRLAHAEGLPLPAYQSAEAAGFDLVAAVPEKAPLVLAPGARGLVPTGLVFELPTGSEAQVRPRSGLAVKFGVTVLNSPGTIDADYRGEVGVILVNLGDAPFVINRGDRIAQVVIAPVTRAAVREAKKLSATARNTGGFGSTGTAAKASRPKIENGGRAGKGIRTARRKPSNRRSTRPAKQ